MTASEAFPAVLDAAAREATAMTQHLIQLHSLHTQSGWSLDESRGRLIFDKITFAAQVVGHFEDGQWNWGWQDPLFQPSLVQAASHVRGWGQTNDISLLTEPTHAIDEATAWKLAAFTARLVDWPGIYCGGAGRGALYLTFAPTADPRGGPDRVVPKGLNVLP